jgi:hypothetical protein
MFPLDVRRGACLFALGLSLLCPLQATAEPASPYRPSLQLVDLTSWVGENIGYKRGFLTATRDGFRWQNGSRARFWGINIANRNLWIPRDEIDKVVDALAASGTNLVRFEALDSRGGLLEVPGKAGTRVINSEKLDTLHYWIAKLHEKGILYYLDLIDFREFQPEDGVENAKNLPRAGRPYAVFDRRLIELQKEYATQLLTTVNSYTGKAPVDDAGLVLLEICNESGFFLHQKHTDDMIEPYRGRFSKRWNAWLRSRYEDRETLAKVWGTALSKEESPENDTVKLPQLSRKVRDVRQSDSIRFLHQLEREYFAAMRDHVRSLGLQIPISAAVSSDVPADLAAVSAELDFLTENHYYDHPAFGGADWQGKFFHNNKNPLRDDSASAFAPFVAQLRWDAKPVVVREWATVWPNRYRAISVPEAAAYARLHDIDAMILFGYKTGLVGDRLVEFGYQVDPPVWDLFGIGSMLFHRGDISTPSDIAVLEYDDQQLFRGDLSANDLVRIAFSQRLASTRTGGNMPVGEVTVLKPGPRSGRANEWLQQLPVSTGGNALEAGVYTSSNGQIVRDTANGRILLQAPRLLAAAGELAHERLQVGPLEFTTQTPVGALVVQSLDGKDLAQSGQWLMKMVSVAENTGQKLLPTPTGPLPYVLDQPGDSPVRTLGQLTPNGTRVLLWNGDSLSVDQVNGSWELLVSGASVRFWSDVPQAAVTYRGRRFLNNAASGVPLRWNNAQPDAYEFVPTFP